MSRCARDRDDDITKILRQSFDVIACGGPTTTTSVYIDLFITIPMSLFATAIRFSVPSLTKRIAKVL